MKFSISVPDDLWAKAQALSEDGPSDLVQRALRALLDQRLLAERPLANAPYQDERDSYEPYFSAAVETASSAVLDEIDNGYRLGLLLARHLGPGDLTALDDRRASQELSKLLQTLEPHLHFFSYTFEYGIFGVVPSRASWPNPKLPEGEPNPEERTLVKTVLGNPDEADAADGVLGWDDEGGPILSDGFVRGALNALRDVRDEALRRVGSAQTRRPEDRQ